MNDRDTGEQRVIKPCLPMAIAVVAVPPKPSKEVAECPSCGSDVALDAKECPTCGEIFSEELLQGAAEAAPKSSRIEKVLFYGGLVLVLAGGPGLALGSWLHDVLKIPILGSAYASFGWVNRLFAAAGLLVLLVGIVLLILSLRLIRPTFDYDVGAPKKA